MDDRSSTPENAKTPLGTWSFRAALGVLLLLCAWYSWLSVFPVRRVAESLSFPYQLDAEEGFLLGQVLRLSRGQALYPPIASAPYVVDNYPPLYPVLWAMAGWGKVSLEPGRWLSALSALAAALAVSWMVARSAPKPLAFLTAWLCPLLFLTSYVSIRWSAYARVDFPALALSLWGLAVFSTWGWGDRRSPVGFAAAVLLFALGLFAKQTAVAAPLACLLFLLLAHRKDALRFAGAMVLAVGPPLLLLVLLTGGRYWSHTVAYNKNIMYWGQLVSWFRHLRYFYLYAGLALAVLSVGAACVVLAKKPDETEGPRRPTEPLVLFFLYFLLCVVSLVSLAKAGAAENYLLEPVAGSALFIGVALGRLVEKAWLRERDNRFAAVVFVVLALLVAQAVVARHRVPLAYHSAPKPNPAARLAGKRLVEAIQDLGPGPVLSEDPIYHQLAGRPILFQNFIMTQLAHEGKWDEEPMLERVRRGRIRLVVAHKDFRDEGQYYSRYSPALRRALLENYELVRKIPRGRLQTIYLYRPRSK